MDDLPFVALIAVVLVLVIAFITVNGLPIAS